MATETLKLTDSSEVLLARVLKLNTEGGVAKWKTAGRLASHLLERETLSTDKKIDALCGRGFAGRMLRTCDEAVSDFEEAWTLVELGDNTKQKADVVRQLIDAWRTQDRDYRLTTPEEKQVKKDAGLVKAREYKLVGLELLDELCGAPCVEKANLEMDLGLLELERTHEAEKQAKTILGIEGDEPFDFNRDWRQEYAGNGRLVALKTEAQSGAGAAMQFYLQAERDLQTLRKDDSQNSYLINRQGRLATIKGDAGKKLGNYDEALAVQGKSRALSAQVGNLRDELNAIMSIGSIYELQGKMEDAEEMYREALTLAVSKDPEVHQMAQQALNRLAA